MLGRGAVAKRITIGEVRELRVGELVKLKERRTPHSAVQRFRDSHRKVAWLFAVGMKVHEVVKASGYSYSRVTTLHITPAFQQLIAEIRESVDERRSEVVDEFEELVHGNMMKAERMLSDKLEDADEEGEFLPTRELIAISRDAADRLGYGKKNTQVNVNVDFAAKLERTIARSNQAKVIELKPNAVSPPRPPQATPLEAQSRPRRSAVSPSRASMAAPQPIKRRALA